MHHRHVLLIGSILALVASCGGDDTTSSTSTRAVTSTTPTTTAEISTVTTAPVTSTTQAPTTTSAPVTSTTQPSTSSIDASTSTTQAPTSTPAAAMSDPPFVELAGAAWSTVYGFGGAWIQVDPPVDQVVKVDEASGEVTLRIDGAWNVAVANDAVWVVDGSQARKIDPMTGEVLLVAQATEASCVAVGAGS